MQQYGLQDRYVDVLVSDFSLVFWKDSVQFDAIITDRKSLLFFLRYCCCYFGYTAAPYGIRESTERVGTQKTDYSISEEHLPTHIPAKTDYGIPSIYRDLIVFAAKHLKIGGRLVCWFPVFR